MAIKKVLLLKIGIPCILLFLSFYPLRSARLLDISVSGTTGLTEVMISFDSPVNYTEFALENKLIFDLIKTESGLDANKFGGIDRGGISSISLIPFYTAGLLRLTIELSKGESYTASIENNRLFVRVDNPGGESFTTWIASEQEITASSLGYEETYYEVPGLISLDLEEANIQTILRAMAHYGGKNIVAGEEVKGVITVKLSNVTWRQAFDVIVRTAGFSYREDENIIRVAEGTTFDKERESSELAQLAVCRVYKLSFAEPKEVKKSIDKLLSKKGKIEIDERTNSLIITDIETRQVDIKNLIDILDSPNPQVAIEARVVDLDYDFARDLGISWSASNLRSRRYNISGAGTLSAPVPGVIDISVGTIRDFAKINAVLNINESEGRTKTIANPRITALNNREAEIMIGKKFPVNIYDQSGNLVTRYFEVGTRLKVTPHINSMNEITMDIDVELSSVDPTTLIITSTEAETKQLVKNGETVVLGGFIREDEKRSETGVPILRSIPIIGFLFKKTGKSVSKREVLIFLTPHLVKYY